MLHGDDAVLDRSGDGGSDLRVAFHFTATVLQHGTQTIDSEWVGGTALTTTMKSKIKFSTRAASKHFGSSRSSSERLRRV